MLPLGCHTAEIRRNKAPTAKAVLGLPERPVAFAPRLPQHRTRQRFTLGPPPAPLLPPPAPLLPPSSGLRGLGKATAGRRTPAPWTEQAQHPLQKWICQEAPSLSTKNLHTHTPHPLGGGWGLRGDTSDSPRGLGGSGEPPPLPTVDPAKRGRKGFYQARGLLLTKVEAVIGRVRPPPLLRAVAGHGAEAAPRRPPPRRRQQPRQPRRRTHNGGGRLPSPSCGRRACATPRRSPPSLP